MPRAEPRALCSPPTRGRLRLRLYPYNHTYVHALTQSVSLGLLRDEGARGLGVRLAGVELEGRVASSAGEEEVPEEGVEYEFEYARAGSHTLPGGGRSRRSAAPLTARMLPVRAAQV